jgi:glycosyltransferase involved in cell wall biosynthesis
MCSESLQVEGRKLLQRYKGTVCDRPLKVLYVNDYDLLNQRFNGFDIKEPLRDFGIDSRFIVWKKSSRDPAVRQIGWGRHNSIIRTVIKIFERCLGVQNLFYPCALKLLINQWYKETEIVHLHLIHNEMISLWAIPKMCREKKVVWTVHDPWVVTGHCIHPFDCQNWRLECPECSRLRTPKITYIDMAHIMCVIKRKLIQSSSLHLVVASKWMKDMLQESPITRGKDIIIIPFGIDTQHLQRLDHTMCRRRLGIDKKSLVVTFRSDPGPYKGTKDVVQALSMMNYDGDLTVLTFGKKNNVEALKDLFHVIDFGWADAEEMKDIFGATDIFVMPSIAESFGMMAIESLACGVPVIAYDSTALGEIVEDGITGRLVPRGDVDDLRSAIGELIVNPSLREQMGENGKRVVRERYSIEMQVKRTAELYRSISARSVDRR